MTDITSKYKCLVVDPPWRQKKTGLRKSRPNQTQYLDYKTLSKNEIIDIPVSNWSAENSFIWLWVTNSKDYITKEPIIKMGFDILQAWGFTYYTMLTWDKKTGPCPFGPYQITTEHILFGYKGKVKFSKESMGKMKTCFEERTKTHSEKPKYLYNFIAEYFEGPRINVFARQNRHGFDGWGDEYVNNKEDDK